MRALLIPLALAQCFTPPPIQRCHRSSYSFTVSTTATPLDTSYDAQKVNGAPIIDTDTHDKATEEDAFTLLSTLAATTLLQSDRRRGEFNIHVYKYWFLFLMYLQ